MKSIIIIVFSLCLISCNLQEYKKRALEKHLSDSLKTDSIKRAVIEDSILISSFKKWVSSDPRNITFIHPLFVSDINAEMSAHLNFVILKTKPTILSSIVRKEVNDHFKFGYFIRNDVTETEWSDCNFSVKDINIYKVGKTYFQLIVTTDNRTDTTTFNEVSPDNFLKAISEHLNDKLKVEEFFERVEVGHFEGEKKLQNRKVRSFILSDENKKALQDSYKLYLILDRGNSFILQ